MLSTKSYEVVAAGVAIALIGDDELEEIFVNCHESLNWSRANCCLRQVLKSRRDMDRITREMVKRGILPAAIISG